MGKLIYQPKGKAREYSPWACNLFNGCTNNCSYCYNKKGVPCVFLSKKRPNNMMIELFERYKDLVKVGFTLTGMDELEPNADTNSERIEAIRDLEKRGVHTWASIEPIINVARSLYLMSRAHNVGCREFKIGVLSGKKDYTPRDILDFKQNVDEFFPDCTILWKNSLLEYIS